MISKLLVAWPFLVLTATFTYFGQYPIAALFVCGIPFALELRLIQIKLNLLLEKNGLPTTERDIDSR